jgi:hypothetical protein
MRKPILVICFVLLALCWPAVVLAAPPVSSGPDQCIECHETETNAWMASPHANTLASNEVAATCESCHGEYVEDHPEAGIMKLTINSDTCADCHADTVGQLQNTVHADAGVECIGCHLSHSQEFRVTDDDRCQSCHRESAQVVTHSAHGLADIGCTDCHVNSVPAPTDDKNVSFISDHLKPAVEAPDHDFTTVSDASCLGCHTEDAHNGLPALEGERVTQARMVAMAESVPDLTAKIREAEQNNRSLMIMAPLALGFGIALGIALTGVMAMGYFCINQRRAEQ